QLLRSVVFLSFFFQAEDGIRDFHVTGVQTCALPIFPMNTTLVSRSGDPGRPIWRRKAWAYATWATISPGSRCRSNPNCPVAQKVHPRAHPACEEMHKVARRG